MSENQAQDILNAGAALGNVRGDGINMEPFAVIPDGYHLQGVAQAMLAPIRNKGETLLLDEASFVAFVNLHKTDNTDLYFNSRNPGFKAVFNAARDGAPAWGDHSAVYRMPLSVEWETWKKADGQRMGQEDFARFVEANTPDITEPDSADMLEIALSLQAKKKVSFASGLRLSNGATELTYEEQIDGTAAKGKLRVPEHILLAIPVFEGGGRYQVEAKFRYRIQEGGKLTMWYELVRAHVIIADAVQKAREAIEKGTKLAAFNASV